MTQDNTKDLTVISDAKTAEPTNGLYEKALTLRYAGKNCKEIAEAVGVAHGTVRNWFSKGGLLERNYANLKVMQHAKALETQESLQEHIRLEAIDAHGRTVERAKMHYDNPLGQRADEKLMDAGGLLSGKEDKYSGPTLDPHNLDNSIERFSAYWSTEFQRIYANDQIRVLVSKFGVSLERVSQLSELIVSLHKRGLLGPKRSNP